MGETNRWVNDRWTDRQMEYRNIDQFIDAKYRKKMDKFKDT